MADEPTISDEPTGDLDRRRRFDAVVVAYVKAESTAGSRQTAGSCSPPTPTWRTS